jgi:hypothetical protein
LVALAVFGGVGLLFVAVDVGREWEVADAFECGVEVGGGGEAEGALAVVAGGEDGCGEEWWRFLPGPRIRTRGTQGRGGVEVEGFAGLDFFGGFDEGQPVVVALRVGKVFGEEDFDVAGGCGGVVLRGEASAGGEEAGGEDAGVVEDEEVARTEEGGEIGEVAVGEGSGAAVECHHAAGAAHRGRVLRDEVFGKRVVEVGDEHGGEGLGCRV